MKRITIDPITRLEGHGKIEIFLDDAGNVSNAYLLIPELRGFEKFCEGRNIEELPRITAKICGVCPEAHHLASAKATDAVFKAVLPSAAKKLRELFYCAHMIHSHIAHFYALAAPDFVCGPDAPPSERNIIGVVAKVGIDVGKDVIKHRAYAQEIQAVIGGRATYPVCGLPGGCSKSLKEEDRKVVEQKARALVEFAKFSLKLFEDLVLKNKGYLDLILAKDKYYIETSYMGLVDKNNKVNFYDGDVRVVDWEGKEMLKFAPENYLEHIAEHVEPWSYMKFPYIKKAGWPGLSEDKSRSHLRVAPLARLNASAGMATPLAQEQFDKMYSTFGAKPVHNTLGFHWARLIELLYAAERLLELSTDGEITSENVRVIPDKVPTEGVGIVEAPRGTLIHHYKTDKNGIVEKANLVVATVFNNPAMNISIAKAAKAFIKGSEVKEGLLNMVEMAFRAYDPCMSCATHSISGSMPLVVTVKNKTGETLRVVRRD